MSREEALIIIRSGKNGNQILDLLDKVSSLCTDADEEVSDLEFAEWRSKNCPLRPISATEVGYYYVCYQSN